jgi:hypothetical protein
MCRQGYQSCHQPMSHVSKPVFVRMVENMTKSRRGPRPYKMADTFPEEGELLLHQRYGRAILPSLRDPG